MSQTETRLAHLSLLCAQRPHADPVFLAAVATLVACAWSDHEAALLSGEPELSPFADLETLPTGDPFQAALVYLQASV